MELGTDHSRRGNKSVNTLRRWIGSGDDSQRNVLVLNILLLGDRQSGRSSVGNALIGQSFY